MNSCMHYQPGVSASRICERCEAEGPAVLPDDLSRIVNLYGSPDRDVSSDMAVTRPGAESRSLEYFRAKVLFTFLPEQGRSSDGEARWQLLLVNDTASLHSISQWAAAQRFYERQG